MYRHKFSNTRRSRYQKNSQPSQNQILSRQLTETLKKLFKAITFIQQLQPTEDVAESEIIQLKYLIDYVDRLMKNHTSIELVRPPQQFRTTRLHIPQC
jgi:hypothetical protein